MTYDPYKSIPQEFIPTRSDEYALFHIAIAVRIAIKLRHDFRTAAILEGKLDRGLPRKAPPWESEFAKSGFADAKSTKGIAAEHARVKAEAFTYGVRVTGNKLLGKLVHENLFSLFPDIGYSSVTGDVLQRLLKDEKQTVLKIFHPLGVEDNAKIINLLIKKPTNFYW